jgi:hypothetical protein
MSDNGWPGEPGVPPKSEYRGWHWLYLYNGIPCPAYWDGYWLVNGSRIQAEDLNPQIKYWGECLTPAQVDIHKHAAVVAYANLLNLPAPKPPTPSST